MRPDFPGLNELMMSDTPTGSYRAHCQHPRRLHALRIRAQVESAIRQFFVQRDFLEVRTPLLVPSPGLETHIRPFQVTPWAQSDGTNSSAREPLFLPTSPEFAMKRLLVGGHPRIFQICAAFRDEPNSPHHRPEFTLLEWYRSSAGLTDILHDTQDLLVHLGQCIHQGSSFQFGTNRISLTPPWPQATVAELFARHTGIDLTRACTRESLLEAARQKNVSIFQSSSAEESFDDLFHKIWLEHIEPQLPSDRPLFVMQFPASQAALSVIDPAVPPSQLATARRFEFFIGGLELGNAFEELTDPVEQHRRFVRDMDLRETIYGATFPKSPIDQGLLEALREGLPPSGGIAVGVDRLVMLLANESDIQFTFHL